MKSVAALTAILSLTVPTVPILAQNADPIGGGRGTSATRTLPTQTVKPVVDWSRISKLSPGTVIVIGWSESTFTRLDVVSANDDELIALELSDKGLPGPVVKQLRKVAKSHPSYFVRPRSPGTTMLMGSDVSVESSEVFLHDEKVADWQEIVRTFARVDVERATTLTILPPAKGMPLGAQICIVVSVAVAAFAIIVAHLIPYT